MHEVITESLLDNGANKKQAGRLPAIVAIIGILALAAGLVGYSVAQMPSEDSLSEDVVMEKIASMQNQTDLVLVPYDVNCYGFTGGTCLTRPCDVERQATCVDGKCSCVNSCTGADGVCRGGPGSKYKRVAEGFTLANGKWPSHWLFMQRVSALNQLKISMASSFLFWGAQYFDLYELPGKINGRKQYFLASHKWPNYVAAMQFTGGPLNLGTSLWGLFAVNLVKTIAPSNVDGIVLQVCSLAKTGEKNSIMIGSSGKVRTEWAYVHHFSWFVYGWQLSSDPGAGGHWIVQGWTVSGLEDC